MKIHRLCVMYNVVAQPDSMEGTHQVAPAADEMQ